jgi:hypothetical protein
MIDPIFILLVGVVIVVGGIIGFKLHPFLALLLAALAVALLIYRRRTDSGDYSRSLPFHWSQYLFIGRFQFCTCIGQ